jgi:hypothetical protein
MEVRCASPFDLSQIAATLVRMHREAEFDLAPINSHTLMATVNNTIHNGVVLVAVDEGRVVGTIGGTTGRDWWSDDEYFSDLWFYVSSEARASRAAILLIKKFVSEIRAGFPGHKIRLGHVFSGDIARKDKFFERLGLTKAGSLFMEA